jgi:hypothetical protein
MSKLRIYHIRNGETEYHRVSDLEHARILINALAQSDLLDKSVEWNAFGCEEWNEDEKEWEEWHDEGGQILKT